MTWPYYFTLKHFTFLFIYWGVKHLFEITKSKFLICSNMGILSAITYLTFWMVLSIEGFSVPPHYHKDMSDTVIGMVLSISLEVLGLSHMLCHSSLSYINHKSRIYWQGGSSHAIRKHGIVYLKVLYTYGPNPLWTLISILSLHLNIKLLGSGSEWPMWNVNNKYLLSAY